MQLQNQVRQLRPVPTPGTAEHLLAGIRELAPEIATRTAEIEAARQVPPDLVERLRRIGIFRMFAPRSHGGLELDLPAGLDVIAALSRIDGSIGWTAMIGSGGVALFAPLLPRATYDEVYANGPDVIGAGSVQPSGTAEATEGGWRINGRWPFASGCEHADWIGGFCIMTRGGKPILDEKGQPQIRGCFLPAPEWEIEDTWHAAGLKGTGSHHIRLKDKMAPAENFVDFMAGVPCLPGPLYQAPRHFLPLFHAAFSVGMAEGALGEAVALANTGRQQFRAPVPMRESETFHGELGRIAAEVKAARVMFQAQVAEHWRHALAGTLRDEARYTEGTRSAVWIVTTCVRSVDACFALAGASAVYETSPLQRRLRDIHVAAQHAAVQQRHYASAGKLLLEAAAA